MQTNLDMRVCQTRIFACRKKQLIFYLGLIYLFAPKSARWRSFTNQPNTTERVGNIFKFERSLCPASAYKEDVVFRLLRFNLLYYVYIIKVTFVLQHLNILHQLKVHIYL